MHKILPAILASTIEEFNQKLGILSSFSNELQIDIMDGEFVLEKSFELSEIDSLPTDHTFEVHLMVAYPLEYIPQLKRLGIKKVIFHNEIDIETSEVIEGFKKEGFTVFLASNPDSEIIEIEKYIENVDGIMLMSVNPGKSGQDFIHSIFEKIRFLKEKYPELLIEVDGGINKENIKEVFDAGASIAVVGSGILKADNPIEEWEKIQELINE